MQTSSRLSLDTLIVETDRSIRIHVSVAHGPFNLKIIPVCVKTTSGRGHTAVVLARWTGVVDDTFVQLNGDNLQATTATTQRSG
jgi:hypothetical protein